MPESNCPSGLQSLSLVPHANLPLDLKPAWSIATAKAELPDGKSVLVCYVYDATFKKWVSATVWDASDPWSVVWALEQATSKNAPFTLLLAHEEGMSLPHLMAWASQEGVLVLADVKWRRDDVLPVPTTASLWRSIEDAKACVDRLFGCHLDADRAKMIDAHVEPPSRSLVEGP